MITLKHNPYRNIVFFLNYGLQNHQIISVFLLYTSHHNSCMEKTIFNYFDEMNCTFLDNLHISKELIYHGINHNKLVMNICSHQVHPTWIASLSIALPNLGGAGLCEIPLQGPLISLTDQHSKRHKNQQLHNIVLVASDLSCLLCIDPNTRPGHWAT